MKTIVKAVVKIEGIHRWENCNIKEVSFLKNFHRHIFNIIAKVEVSHDDRQVEFIQLSRLIEDHLKSEYWSTYEQCCFFRNKSCEMIAKELLAVFNLIECEVNEDGEGGAIVIKEK